MERTSAENTDGTYIGNSEEFHRKTHDVICKRYFGIYLGVNPGGMPGEILERASGGIPERFLETKGISRGIPDRIQQELRQKFQKESQEQSMKKSLSNT